MQSIFEWFGDSPMRSDRPWLILGKGPSFAKLPLYDLSRFQTLILNHAIRERPATIAHIIDLDVVNHCGAALENNAEAVVLPWMPHVANVPGEFNLEELAQTHPVLRRLAAAGRLYWYNLSTAKRPRAGSPIIEVKFFSGEAALNILAQAGVRCVRSLGVDGGATYSRQFNDLKDVTLLANTQKSFDVQFAVFAEIIRRTGVDYAPLDVQSPIRVYVGCTEPEMLPCKVLEYSLRRHASMSLELFPLYRAAIEIPQPKEKANRARTPFSFQRFLIPALAGYTGRAIYLDSDMQVFHDVRQLWTLPLDATDLLAVGDSSERERPPQFSVMVLNCERLRWKITDIVAGLDRGRYSYEALMGRMVVAENVRADINPCWNSLEAYCEHETALLHYTNMSMQPWVCPDNPLGYLWMRELFAALDDNFISPEFVRSEVRRNHVRPTLLYQIKHRIEDARLLKRSRALDRCFVAPYQRMGGSAVSSAGAFGLGSKKILNAVLTSVYGRELKRDA